HGSYHWNFERGLSIVTLPLMIGAYAVGPQPYIDLALGVVIPLHTHIGFGAIIEDYLPQRRTGVIYKLANGTLYVATGLVLYGAYQFNTNDIGITAFVGRLWTGKQ
ncbi:CybS-domain-containing protein, partial [Blyttiomyces helicus]